MTIAINLSINEALTAAWDGCRMQTGHAQHRTVLLGGRFVPYETRSSPTAAQSQSQSSRALGQRQSSKALGGGCFNQEGDGQELGQCTVKEQKEERGAVVRGRRRTSTSSGSCWLDWEDGPRQGPH